MALLGEGEAGRGHGRIWRSREGYREALRGTETQRLWRGLWRGTERQGWVRGGTERQGEVGGGKEWYGEGGNGASGEQCNKGNRC